MQATKTTYHQITLRLWLTKVALLLSVLAFSGLAAHSYSAPLASTTTELVETRQIAHAQSLAQWSILPKSSSSINKLPFAHSALHIYNDLVLVRYQVAFEQILAHKASTFKSPIQLLPSFKEEDSFLHALS